MRYESTPVSVIRAIIFTIVGIAFIMAGLKSDDASGLNYVFLGFGVLDILWALWIVISMIRRKNS